MNLILINLIVLFGKLHLIYADFQLLILHTNDMHSRFDETNVASELVKNNAPDGPTFGGFARIKTAVKEAREEANKKGIPSIFLNAGDTFQGTSFYTLLKTDIVADLISMLGIDAMCLGNHEFDDGPAELFKYLNNISIPVVHSNLNFTQEPQFSSLAHLGSRLILDVNNHRIGIVGSLTQDTKNQSNVGKVIFKDEIESIKREAAMLKSEGVNIIIALTHIGFEMDLKLAKEVPDLSLVIGGHTNTFLYNPQERGPSTEKPDGPYPFYVTQNSGKIVPVITAYAYTKYLGKLWATFADNGTFISAAKESNAILINSSVVMDEEVQTRVLQWRAKINDKLIKVVGQTYVELNDMHVWCKILECNLGNLVADSFVDYFAEKYRGADGWTDTPIALIQSGSIRVSHHNLGVRDNPNLEDTSFNRTVPLYCHLLRKASVFELGRSEDETPAELIANIESFQLGEELFQKEMEQKNFTLETEFRIGDFNQALHIPSFKCSDFHGLMSLFVTPAFIPHSAFLFAYHSNFNSIAKREIHGSASTTPILVATVDELGNFNTGDWVQEFRRLAEDATNLTYDQLMEILPYRSAVVKLHLSGSTLKEALEHAVHDYKYLYSKEVPNEFLQVSGIHVTYDMKKPQGNRVVKVSIRCGNCTIPEYFPLVETQMYTAAVMEFVTRGGDGFNMFKNCQTEIVPGENGDTSLTDTDALARYLEKYKTVYSEVSGRIEVLTAENHSHSIHALSKSFYYLLFILVVFLGPIC